MGRIETYSPKNILAGNGQLGIDLGAAGRNPSGLPDTSLANRGINSPVVQIAVMGATSTTVTGFFPWSRGFASIASNFSQIGTDDPNTTQAEAYLGFVDVQTDSVGALTFQFVIPNGFEFFTATATDLDPFDSDGTSELGPSPDYLGAFDEDTEQDISLPQPSDLDEIVYSQVTITGVSGTGEYVHGSIPKRNAGKISVIRRPENFSGVYYLLL